MFFKARKTFWSDEMRSEYVEGLRYVARSGRLQRLIQRWVEEGLVELIDDGGKSALQGKG